MEDDVISTIDLVRTRSFWGLAAVSDAAITACALMNVDVSTSLLKTGIKMKAHVQFA